MPTAGSQYSRYKIPDNENPSGIICISVPVPDDREWLGMFYGALWRMSIQSHYERDDDKSAEGVAARWRQVWRDTDLPCCQDDPSQINIEISSQLVQNMQMAFTWSQLWITGTQVVSTTYYEIPVTFSTDPGDVGDELVQREQALCLACQGLFHEIMNYMESWLIGNFDEVAQAAGGTIVAAAAVSGLVMWPVLIGWVVAGIIAEECFRQLRNTEYREYIICRAFENLKGLNPNSRPDFESALTADPIGRPQPEDPVKDQARDLIELYLRSQLNNLDNYLMFAGQLGTAMDIARSGIDVGCTCEPSEGEWTHTWLMTSGNDDIIIDTMCGVDGTYNAVDDRYESIKATAPNCTDSGAVSVEIPIPGGGFVTSARMRYDMYNEQFNNRSAVISSVKNFVGGGHVEHARFTGNQQYFDKLLEATDPGLVTELFFSVMNRQTSGTAGRSKVLQITIEGTGPDPYP